LRLATSNIRKSRLIAGISDYILLLVTQESGPEACLDSQVYQSDKSEGHTIEITPGAKLGEVVSMQV
jgi:hypothetical protein